MAEQDPDRLERLSVINAIRPASGNPTFSACDAQYSSVMQVCLVMIFVILQPTNNTKSWIGVEHTSVQI